MIVSMLDMKCASHLLERKKNNALRYTGDNLFSSAKSVDVYLLMSMSVTINSG